MGGVRRWERVGATRQEDVHAEETVQSLRFGEMCSTVAHERKDQAQARNSPAGVSVLRGPLNFKVKVVADDQVFWPESR